MKTNSIGLFLVFAGLTVLNSCKEKPEELIQPLLAAPSLIEVTVTSAIVEGKVLSQGSAVITARGFCWSTDSDPTLLDNKLTEGKGLGSFTGRISGLLPGTDYYIRTWATSMEGTTYGDALMITTPLTATPASLITLVPENITSSSVVSGGNITDIGNGDVIERGICWSTDPVPTIENNRVTAAITGTGSGSFVLKLTSLESGTTYYLRAYAINGAGVSYGPEISFRTKANLGIRGADFPGEAKYFTITFSIENMLFVGLGSLDWWDFLPSGDFWGWDQVTNQWTKLAQYPGTYLNPTGFAVGGKGYVYTNRWTAGGEYTNELWEYDPEINKWTQKSSLPAIGSRISPVTFSIGLKGYIGMGNMATSNSNYVYLNDLWEWNQATDEWTRKADFPGPGRFGAAAFAIGNKGYVGVGITSGDHLVGDFWEYDQASDKWTRKADFAGDARAYVVSFSNGNKGYIGAGRWINGSYDREAEFWEWDQALNSWNVIGTVAEPDYLWAGGSVGNHGYYIKEPAIISDPLELWIFPLTSVKY